MRMDTDNGNEDIADDDVLAMDVDSVGYDERSHSDLELNDFCHAKIKAMRDALLDGYEVDADPPSLSSICNLTTS